MIKFKSMFRDELSGFLLLREVAMSKSAYDHDCHYLKKFDEYIFDNRCTTKKLTEDMITGWINTLNGKRSSIANEVIVIRIFFEIYQ